MLIVIKFFTVVLFSLVLCSCSKDKQHNQSICFSAYPEEQFEYKKKKFLSERGRSYTFIVDLEKYYKSIKLPVDDRMKLRVLVGHPSRYPTARIINKMLTNKTGRVAPDTIDGLKRYIQTLVPVNDDEFNAENTDYKDVLVKNLDDSLMIRCSRRGDSKVNPSCKFTYRLKSVDVSYYVSLPLIAMWSSIKEDVDRHLLSKEKCRSSMVK